MKKSLTSWQENPERTIERCLGLASSLETGLLVYRYQVNKTETILSPRETEAHAHVGRLCRCGHCLDCFVRVAVDTMEDYYPTDPELDQAWVMRWT